MFEPHSAGFHGLPPDEWEQRRRQIIQDAHAARALAFRDLFGQILLPIRRMASGVGAALRRWGRAYATWRTRRQAIAELAGLDDRALKDFGISRSEIESVVYGGGSKRVAEGKAAAVLFHKPYDGPTTGRELAQKQLIEKNAA
jgi:uncharacterized protein YjiS (DUF1127 family)